MTLFGYFSRALLACSLLLASKVGTAGEMSPIKPLAIGDTFVISTPALNEDRRINVVFPPGYVPTPDGAKLPILILLDGGAGESLLPVAGVLHELIAAGAIRPFLLVGIENTQRRRDFTMPTSNPEEEQLAGPVGGAHIFRGFIVNELLPELYNRYPVTQEKAVVGVGLGGLFVVESFLLDPDAFDIHIALDPELTWNSSWLLNYAEAAINERDRSKKSLLLAHSGTAASAESSTRLDAAMRGCQRGCAKYAYFPLPESSPSPFLSRALRTLLPITQRALPAK